MPDKNCQTVCHWEKKTCAYCILPLNVYFKLLRAGGLIGDNSIFRYSNVCKNTYNFLLTSITLSLKSVMIWMIK